MSMIVRCTTSTQPPFLTLYPLPFSSFPLFLFSSPLSALCSFRCSLNPPKKTSQANSKHAMYYSILALTISPSPSCILHLFLSFFLHILHSLPFLSLHSNPPSPLFSFSSSFPFPIFYPINTSLELGATLTLTLTLTPTSPVRLVE